MDTQITCPHCRQLLTFHRPVPVGSKVKCPACQRPFVRAKPAAGVVQVAAPFSPPPEVANVNGHQGPIPAGPRRPKMREEGGEPAPKRYKPGIAGLVLLMTAVFVVLGLVVGLCLFVYLVGEPTPEGNQAPTPEGNQVAQLPVAEPEAADPPESAEANPIAPNKTSEPKPELVEVLKPPEIPSKKEIGPRPTLTPAIQKQIDLAIDRGVMFLKNNQHPSGRWIGFFKDKNLKTKDFGDYFPVGYAALPALTLLECGVPKNDPAIQRAAKFVREKADEITQTYELSLAILFLDKLQNPKDKRYIQEFATRLVAGQNYYGGWSYECPSVRPGTRKELLTFLKREREWKLKNLIGTGGLTNPLQLSEADLQKKPFPATGGVPQMPLSQDQSRDAMSQERGKKAVDRSSGDKSEDQGRALLTGRPRTADSTPGKSQPENSRPSSNEDSPGPGKASGPGKETEGLAKNKDQPKKTKPPVVPTFLRHLPIFSIGSSKLGLDEHRLFGDNSNTQFALLGLWVARRYDIPLERTFALAELRFRQTQNPDDGWFYGGLNMNEKERFDSTPTMTCVGLLGLAIGKGSEYELLNLEKGIQGMTVQKLTKQDGGIHRGLKKLATVVGHPMGMTSAPKTVNHYLLWSVERMAVLYNLKTLGDKDWYLWGAEILLANQRFDGAWAEGKYTGSHPVTDTCFALLFLKRADLAPDLSNNLRLYIPVVDPDRRDGPGGP
jgi:hypothetical protein